MWVTDFKALEVKPPENMGKWLRHAHQISPYLKQCYQQVTLSLVGEEWDQPYADEAALLPHSTVGAFSRLQTSEKAWIRRILLLGDNEICTYGRTVIPQKTYQQYQAIFESLGREFIGESFLYKNKQVTRSPFEYAVVSAHEPLFVEILQALSLNQSHEFMWFRRSCFYIEGFPLLVTEVILPSICDCPL